LNNRYDLPPFKFDKDTHKYGNWKCDISNDNIRIYYVVGKNEIEEFEKSDTLKSMIKDGFEYSVKRDWILEYKLILSIDKIGYFNTEE
jgi:mRNA-degrading endonuclease YafQ of YafQ-DinJ toxin-antitoxin module